MTAKLVPSGSQTVGPFFTIGLNYLAGQPVETGFAQRGHVEISGRVLDGAGNPVPDAMLEVWAADSSGRYGAASEEAIGSPPGFRRVVTDQSGQFSFTINKPGAVTFDDGRNQAPHLVVLVFARGLLRHLITRVYFPDEHANASDPVFELIPKERRLTMVARSEGSDSNRLRWDVILQGTDETVFFAW
jgi:protocatechuate 3,4-dioxygenase, alpha subunit